MAAFDAAIAYLSDVERSSIESVVVTAIVDVGGRHGGTVGAVACNILLWRLIAKAAIYLRFVSRYPAAVVLCSGKQFLCVFRFQVLVHSFRVSLTCVKLHRFYVQFNLERELRKEVQPAFQRVRRHKLYLVFPDVRRRDALLAGSRSRTLVVAVCATTVAASVAWIAAT